MRHAKACTVSQVRVRLLPAVYIATALLLTTQRTQSVLGASTSIGPRSTRRRSRSIDAMALWHVHVCSQYE